MYPGYSPAHYRYGDAAADFGRNWADAKKRGLEFQPRTDGPQYEFGQGKGSKRRRVEEELGVEREEPQPPKQTQQSDTNVTTGTPKLEPNVANGTSPLFVVDLKPTRVKISGTLKSPLKQETEGESVKSTANGRQKTSGGGPEVEYENIDAEVDARLREKEEKRKSKKTTTKRKRESNTSTDSGILSAALMGEKPKKKRSRNTSDIESTMQVKTKGS